MRDLLTVLKTAVRLVSGRGVYPSYAQDGEDVLVHSLLRKDDGVYVDVGAYHPILYSNTYSFYRRGWKGVVIDPNSAMRSLYKVFRPRDAFVHAGVAKVSETRPYYLFSDGAYNTFSKEDADALAKKEYPRLQETRNVACKPLSEILREQGITHIDFLTIDVEGLDREVLESHDWSIRPTVIAVEDNQFTVAAPEKSRVYEYLVQKGYHLAAFAPRTLIFSSSS